MALLYSALHVLYCENVYTETYAQNTFQIRNSFARRKKSFMQNILMYTLNFYEKLQNMKEKCFGNKKNVLNYSIYSIYIIIIIIIIGVYEAGKCSNVNFFYEWNFRSRDFVGCMQLDIF